MPRFLSVSLAPLAAALLCVADSAPAQSNTAGSGSGSGSAMAGSGSGTTDNPVGLSGYCPVALLTARQWVPGSPQHEVVFDGVAYRFPNAEAAEMFRKQPMRYTPVLSGDDVVDYVQTGSRTPGALQTPGGESLGARYLDRHYFFANLANKQAFTANPRRYAEADIAAGGACVVCQVDMNVAMPGDPKFEAVHHGRRFLFAGAEQRQRFIANPRPYLSAAPSGAGSGSGSGSGGASGSSSF